MTHNPRNKDCLLNHRNYSAALRIVDQLRADLAAANAEIAELNSVRHQAIMGRMDAHAELAALTVKAEGLCYQNGDLMLQLAQVKAENERLRTAIEAAPHDSSHCTGPGIGCCCWKGRVL